MKTKRARDEGEKREKREKKGAGEGIEQPNGRKGRKTGLWRGTEGGERQEQRLSSLKPLSAVTCCEDSPGSHTQTSAGGGTSPHLPEQI